MKKQTRDRLEQQFKIYASAHRAGKLGKAKKGYEKLLKKRPDWGQCLTALGHLFLDLGRPNQAKPVFEKAANLTPPDLSACYNLGRLKQLENDHQGAIKIYLRMLEQQPQSGLVWNNIGVAYRDTGRPAKALKSFQTAVKFAPQMAEAWNNLGVAQDEADHGPAAMDSYRKAIELEPEYTSPHLNLGIALQKAGQFEGAEVHYKKVLSIQPDNAIARFMIQSIRGNEPPDAAPVEHVRNIFDQCAENFDTILVDKLAYKTPERLFNLVHPHLTEEMTILDLGCGTGLGAQLYRPFAKRLTGVDVSAKMLEKAGEKNIYNQLERFDLLQPWTFPTKFDLIYSSDVFVYFGNLDPILRSAASYLADGGKIAFSVEQLADNGLDYKLYPSGRYAHSQKYIEKCLDQHGLNILEFQETTIRNQSGNPVQGLLIAAVKN